MAILPIIKIGDPQADILVRKAHRVRDFDATLHKLLDDMLDTIHAHPAVGLAAPQVGVDLRAAVLEYPDESGKMKVYELLNPSILKVSGSAWDKEGCLSIPGSLFTVKRAQAVRVMAQNRHGQQVRFRVYGWLARMFQHEIDHLEGRLVIHHANKADAIGMATT